MSHCTLDIDRVRRETFIASIEHHASLGSTNDRAKELAVAGADELPLMVIADRQTAGRGRGGNRWWSGRGGLTFTLLVEGRTLGDERTSQPLVALASAVAVVETVEQASSLLNAGRQTGGLPRLGLHWPNDVYVGDRKLAGILVEVLPGRRHVVGIGLNTNNTLADAPPEVRHRAVTLLELTGRPQDHTALLIALLQRLAGIFSQLAADASAVACRADELCLQHGKDLTLQLGPQLVTGRCLGIAPDGGLILETPQGRRTFCSGVLQR